MFKRIAVLVLILCLGSSIALFAASGNEKTLSDNEASPRIVIVHCTS
ncbi:MAG: hypothetical protein JSV89_21680 [Spirochaetaceae bacterium]|nr:MAG: hypothetical protein JSV89_21680 [Spirochaetaceae bacterium]